MKIHEISDVDKSLLTLKGIQYNFQEDYKNIISVYPLMGGSTQRKSILINDIDTVCYYISIFLNNGFDNKDPDVIAAKETHDKLQNIKNKLQES